MLQTIRVLAIATTNPPTKLFKCGIRLGASEAVLMHCSIPGTSICHQLKKGVRGMSHLGLGGRVRHGDWVLGQQRLRELHRALAGANAR